MVLRNDDFGRIERLLADGDDVKLQFEITNHVYPKGKTSCNAIAEIPGTDKAGQVVMLGGHLDSWHAATGATDNAIGCSIMMEAARLIEQTGRQPRQTIRVALWSGEEEGLLGSLAYVKQHFGTAESPTPEWSNLEAYFNVDTGTGRIRGRISSVPPRAPPSCGGFWRSMTDHTNLDTYERVIPDDVKKAAAIVATAVWHVANRDEMIPRFTKETMPAPVAPR